MPIQIASPPQSTTKINQEAVGQLVFPQGDSAQLLQTLLNQLAISSQLNTQQPAPLASQLIGQAMSITGHSNT
jgi:hypothetical protein